MKKAVVLLSGGLDSTTCLAIAKSQGYEVYAMSVDYGQRSFAELTAAKKIAKAIGVSAHHIIELGIGTLTGSALTDTTQQIPEDQVGTDIPVTYVPARNTLFLSLALGWAEVLGALDIFIGVSAVDFSNYPDCRPSFIAAFEHMANLATKAGSEGASFKIQTPIIHLSKAETLKWGVELGVDYALTVTCYQANESGQACGVCHSCQLRKKGFDEAGLSDPTAYVERA
jgi:7-cyano-7-deazaguanine synthase